MNKNNQMYNLFEHMMQGYRDNDMGAIESGARCWLMFDPENPFPPDSEAYEVFFKMQRCFIIWRRGDINGRINKRRMSELALKLCKLNPKQPYVYDKKADEEERRQEEIKRKEEEKQLKESLKGEAVNDINPAPTPKKIINEKPQTVLGIIPEKKKKKEKKSWFKFLNPWKKEGE